MENFSLLKSSGDPVKFNPKVLLYCVGTILILVLAYFFLFRAPSDFTPGTIINIEEGRSLRSISKNLEVNRVIRSRVIFETFVIIYGGEKYIAAGDYLFETPTASFVVARRLVKGDRHLAPVKLTIPEGFNVALIAEVGELKLSLFKKDKFLLQAKDKEGYLFPDTYFFSPSDNEEKVIRTMSDNFEKKISPIRPQIIASGRTEKDIIVMASLIEGESKGDVDRELISGILWKRIDKGMPLQVDAEPGTYKNKGLPKVPISNPGLKAILSAIHPKASQYLYYLHDKEGNIHFAATFAEHQANIKKYLTQ